MRLRSKMARVDEDFDKFLKEIARDMRMKTGRSDISERRVTSAIPRVPGLREYLLNADWVNENKIRKQFYGKK